MLLISVAVTLGMAELTVREFFPAYNPAGQVDFYKAPGKNSLYFGKPNTSVRQFSPVGEFDVEVKFDQYGYRSNKDVKTATPDDFVAVGDSFTFGHGVNYEDRFTSLLESDTGANVFNIGIPGNFYGYEDHLQFIRDLGVKTKKNLLFVCMENDLFMYGDDSEQGHVTLQSFGGDTKLQSVKWFLTKNSALYRWVKSVIAEGPLGSVLYKLNLKENVRQQGIQSNDVMHGMVVRSAQKLLQIHQKYNLMLVVLIPSRAVYEGNKDEIKVHEDFALNLLKLGLPVLDLKPIFEQQPHPLNLHYHTDGHWNKDGHRLAANAVEEYLQAHNLAPAKKLR